MLPAGAASPIDLDVGNLFARILGCNCSEFRLAHCAFVRLFASRARSGRSRERPRATGVRGVRVEVGMESASQRSECDDGEDLAGRVLAGKWRLDARIGRGSFGEVWTARHVVTGGLRALKLLDPAMARVPELRERFVREAQAASRIESAFVVEIDDLGHDDETGRVFLVMEWLRGETLHAYLARSPFRMPAHEALYVLGHIADALDAAHRVGVVHRDLKPENVALNWNADGSVRAKLLDFGIAKLTDQWTGRYVALDARALSHGRTEGFLGTPGYGAPEQIRDSARVTAAADMFSLGICAFEMLTGASYWRGQTSAALLAEILHGVTEAPSRRVPDGTLGAAFDAWFFTACATDPDLRFASAAEAIRALDVALAPHEAPSPPASRATRVDSTAPGHPTRRLDPSLAATLPGRTVIAPNPLAWQRSRRRDRAVARAGR
jgi:serine/threonine-protein kinase